MADRKALYLTIVIEPDDDGYLARCPGIQGAFAEGDTIEEAIFNCVDVTKMIAAYRAERGETLGVNEIDLAPETRFSLAIPVGAS
ncbi:MAG: hypothetical protein DRI81_15635 [Chloroflexi bacterium]|nr:MAG: hypothetical protein DRI81_15635 [Chloroflexota bacterium]